MREHSTTAAEEKVFPTDARRDQPLIELRDVDVALNGSTVLRTLNWSLLPRQHWAVLGANGSGKSTFLRLVRGEVWPAPGRGRRLYRLDGSEQSTAIGVQQAIALVSPEAQERYLRQDWRLTAGDVLHTGFAQTDLLYVKLSPAQRQRAEEVAHQLELVSLLRRDVQTLSTGELRKVLIARALVSHPKILLLDEVCDGLDAAFRRGMLAFVDAVARAGTQIIYTTHRADEALPTITHELVLQGGAILRQGRRAPRQPIRASLNRNGESTVPRRNPVGTTTPAGRRRQSSDRVLVRLEKASVFLDRRKILHHVNWEMRCGEHWVVLGGNGAGKTTFLKLVASDVYPALGARVERFGLPARHTIHDLRRRIGCVSPLLQTHYREQLSGEQVVASGFFSSIGLLDRINAQQRRRVRELFEQFGLEDLAARRMTELSFGELRKLLTLRALVHQPALLILDEPFDGLDACARRDFAEALTKIARRGTQLLMVTHHLDDLPPCITHALFLEQGRVAAQGEWPGLRAHPRVRALFGRAVASCVLVSWSATHRRRARRAPA